MIQKLCFCVFAVIFFGSGALAQKTPITLEHILNNTYGATGFGGTWTPDGRVQMTTSGSITRLNVTSGQEETVVPGTAFANYTSSTVQLSADDQFVLVTYSRTNKWRHSYTARYDIYDVTARTFHKLIPGSDSSEDVLQIVRWAPTGSGLAFVYGNNLYYKADGRVSTPVQQLTTDGSEERIFNGHADWVYEEEMFGTNQAFWFSPSGTHLAWVKFDNSQTERFSFPMYGNPGDKSHIYTRMVNIAYPKAGTNNAILRLFSASLTATPIAPKEMDFRSTPPDHLEYIGHVTWGSDQAPLGPQLIVVTLNRAQTISQWHYCNTALQISHCSISYTYSQPNGWVDIYPPMVSRTGEQFLTLTATQVATNVHYMHITRVSRTGGGNVHMTTGSYAVTALLGWDEINGRIYFHGTGAVNNTSPADPSQTHVYSTDVNTIPNPNPTCHSCTVRNSYNEFCLGNSASFNPDFSLYTHTCFGGGNVPADIALRRTSDSTVVRSWQNNSVLRERLATAGVPEQRDFPNVPLPGGFVGKARLFFPPDYDQSKKYPLLIDVYGAPAFFAISQGYSMNWGMSMASSHGVIYGIIDGRGTTRRSMEHMFTLNRRMGTLEVEDQITATQWLIDNYGDNIDADHTGIWGWSYGGFATARAMQLDTTDVFKCGVSVAPVSCWRYYDTIYAERYMKMPTQGDNEAGYDLSDVSANVTNFHNKKFLLVHGNADDNVHYQQAMLLARALEQNDVMFEMLSYPDENHNINGPGMRKHLYHSIQDFLFRECFLEN